MTNSRPSEPAPAFLTRAALRADLARLGLRPGDQVMVHAAAITAFARRWLEARFAIPPRS